MAQNKPTNDRFCKKYATKATNFSKNAISRNASCLNPSKGVHTNYQSHYDWCRRNSRKTVNGARKNIRRLTRQCAGGGAQRKKQGKKAKKPNFTNTPKSCRRYGNWAVKVIKRAQKRGCDVRRTGEVLDPAFHRNWCLSQTPQMMAKAANIHRNGVRDRCKRAGNPVGGAQPGATDDRFCKQYASNVSAVAKDAIARKKSCFNPSKGVHSNYQSHYNWCRKNTRNAVHGAAENIRKLAAICSINLNNLKTDDRFCKQYASNVSAVAKDAIARKKSCFNPSKGVHSNYQSHYDWCRKNTRNAVHGAAENIRKLAAICSINLNNLKTDDRFCKQYASNVSAVAKNAIARNLSCLNPGKGVHSNYQSHYNWCRKNTRNAVHGAADNIKRLAAQCTTARPVPGTQGAAPVGNTPMFTGQITGQSINASEWSVGPYRFQGRGRVNRNATCRVVWNNQTIFEGKCAIEDRGGPGSFEMFGPGIFAKVYAYNPGEGNGGHGIGAVKTRSTSFLATGTLYRNGACWENRANKVCHW